MFSYLGSQISCPEMIDGTQQCVQTTEFTCEVANIPLTHISKRREAGCLLDRVTRYSELLLFVRSIIRYSLPKARNARYIYKDRVEETQEHRD